MSHAILSPSSFKRIKACPASPFLSKGLPPITSEYAEFGTECHDWAAKALDLALRESKSPDIVLRQIQNKDQKWITTEYVTFCINLYSEIRQLSDTTPKYYIEHRVHLTEHIWGTSDFIIVFTNKGKTYLIVVDLKTGSGVKVDAEENEQLAIYAAASANTLKVSPEAFYLYIFQPTLIEDGYERAKITSENMQKFLSEVSRVEKRALKILETGKYSKSDLSVGEHCRFCVAKHTCPQFKQDVHKDALLLLDDLSENLPAVPTDVEKLVRAYKMRPLVDAWFSDLEHHLMSLVRSGAENTGLKLVHSRAYSKWKPDAETVAKGLQKAGVKDPWRRDLITIGEARRLAKKPIDHLTVKSEPKLQLAFEDDKRPAVIPNEKQIALLDDESTTKKKKPASGNSNKRPVARVSGKAKQASRKKVSGKRVPSKKR